MSSSIDDEILGEDVAEQEEGAQSSPSDVSKPLPYKSFKYVLPQIQIVFAQRSHAKVS